ncbi:hypothetical protein KIW84_044110 [Lathyrus oleraceus]|uniref:cellulase n=1 Tax=Pisum sativum TaxID=3888 RepID=A0A9D4XHL0_PEA|nr:hypothetical protein KIW84_044110 [Pisum sativum]
MSTKLNQCIYEPIHLLPKYIQTNGQILGAAEFDNTFGWNNKHVGARILLSKEFLVQNVKSFHDYKGHSENFVCSLIPGAGSSSAQYTPGGLLFKISDSNMQSSTATKIKLEKLMKALMEGEKKEAEQGGDDNGGTDVEDSVGGNNVDTDEDKEAVGEEYAVTPF